MINKKVNKSVIYKTPTHHWKTIRQKRMSKELFAQLW